MILFLSPGVNTCPGTGEATCVHPDLHTGLHPHCNVYDSEGTWNSSHSRCPVPEWVCLFILVPASALVAPYVLQPPCCRVYAPTSVLCCHSDQGSWRKWSETHQQTNKSHWLFPTYNPLLQAAAIFNSAFGSFLVRFLLENNTYHDLTCDVGYSGDSLTVADVGWNTYNSSVCVNIHTTFNDSSLSPWIRAGIILLLRKKNSVWFILRVAVLIQACT